MSTIKFKTASPYVQPTPHPPPEDYFYKIYEDNVALKSDIINDRVLNIAIFGVGRVGTVHLSFLARSPRVKIVYIVDDIDSKWDGLKKFWNLDNTVFLKSAQADKVYNDAKIDAVIVASPTTTHPEIIIKSLEGKKAVFCEKPIAQSRKDSIRCYEVAKKVGKPLFCGFNKRFDPSFAAVRARVQKGDVGHIQTIKVCARDSQLPPLDYLPKSGGIFHDTMIHDIDLATNILGEFPDKVAVQAYANIPEIKAMNDFDSVVATMLFPSGTLAILDNCRNANFGYDQRVEVFGPKGMIIASNEQPVHSVETQYGLNGPNRSPNWYSFPSRFRFAYKNEMEHFLDVALGKSKNTMLPKEVLAVNKIASAFEESARRGTIVELKWEDDELPVYQ